MNLLDGLKINNTIKNSKGGNYYGSTYNSNIDVFSMINRNSSYDNIVKTFVNAIEEDEVLALANLLYILDIRNGKGERRIFKIIYRYLCINYPSLALKIMQFISELGRFDYLLLGIDSPVEEETIGLIREQLDKDIISEKPSLLAKWLPSIRTHNVNNKLGKKVAKLLGYREKEYRKLLANLRSKNNIVEKNLTERNYDNINFEEVPAKAMLKYNVTFDCKMEDKFNKYKNSLRRRETKINTTGLFCYEIIKKILFFIDYDEELYNLMWDNQKDILGDLKQNVLVVADTSGSMWGYKALPYATSVGLAMYISERNNGIFKNHYITFSENPVLQEIKGKTLVEKVHNMNEINARNTDIDKVFDLIIKIASTGNLKQKDLPSHILIISDMEFDEGISSNGKTNYSSWKDKFKNLGYKIPTIIFWNIAGNPGGVPITKFDNDTAIISGFSTNILENLFNLNSYSPVDFMLEKLSKYIELLKQ